MFERGEFVFRCCEDRIRQPRIDEQNFAARRNDLESRLAVPSELGFHIVMKSKTVSRARALEAMTSFK